MFRRSLILTAILLSFVTSVSLSQAQTNESATKLAGTQEPAQWWPWPIGGEQRDDQKAAVAEKLPSLGLNADAVTVSGISAGAYMATQLHIAFSASIVGSGSVAGGPWRCSGGSVWTAQSDCMSSPSSVQPNELAEELKRAAKAGDVDPLSNLKSSRLYIFNSDTDAVIRPPMRAKNLEFFEKFIPKASIQVEQNLKSAHGFPTVDYGGACGTAQAPYLMKCNFDTAGEILKQLNPGFPLKRTTMNPKSLFIIDQTEFGSSSALLADAGWVYIPAACQKSGANCRLHVALHGCLQSGENIKDEFAIHAGYNEWAEGSKVVVLYPQAKKSSFSNPNACFDWFGYTNSDFATKNGSQMKTIKAMIDRLVSL